jgi:hypothetical protein
MAFKHGKNTTVLLGTVNLSPYLSSIDLTTTLEMADTTMFASTWKTALPGTLSAQITFAGAHDPAEASLPTLLLAGGSGAVLTYCPAGAVAIGDGARIATVTDVSYQESVPVGGLVAFSGSFDPSGSVGFGEVLHTLSEDTNNTTGTIKADAGATSLGWTASLHVTVVDGGSWVVTIDDDTSATFAGTPATVVTFTAATGATSQVLRGATATATLRRYVRYTATRTGGSAGDGITFFLAYARN